MTLTAPPASTQATSLPPEMKGGVTIQDWRPEDEAFWRDGGKQVARRNLIWSIFAEHLGFSVWLLWSVSAAMLAAMGFSFSVSQLFILVAIPNLVGALIRIPYTFAVPIIGGRNWTVISALLLLLPTAGYAFAVQNPGTPYWAFLLIAALAGLGGGNFASSMANINYFYPARYKGTALGLNAAGGNAGVAFIQFLLPVIVGGAGVFGLVKASEAGIQLQRAGYLYAFLAVVAACAAWMFMNNLAFAKASTAETAAVLRRPHTWVMSFLYIGTFGSFIGYSAAFPLLIRLNFWTDLPEGGGVGIHFAYYAFLGALVGSVARPFGGWLADRFGGTLVTIITFAALAIGTVGILLSLKALAPNPEGDPLITVANESIFPWFLLAFLFVFTATGIGNGSTYRMIPLIWKAKADEATEPGTPERSLAQITATKESSAALGVIGAVGAIGGFGIPMMFGAPWVDNKFDAVINAFWIFTAFYLVCAVVTWFVYARRSVLTDKVPSLGHTKI
ncbi:MFS transporter [Nocardioides limicola]|uniref:MFS transporter n=1 Tax=Nocardioides limicola TaxID=2803368 RepID=UPI001EF043C4|nr:MFS transporter [Nocardioides sp. DJM-14]